jgi:hypothetical protein
MSNTKLNKAKATKNDEFYTQYCDVENECKHYVKEYEGKIIYLPCDSEESAFWKYFVDNFKGFKIKRLTATHYDDGGNTYRLDYNGVETLKTPLKGNGDFRSEECTKIKDESDIIITNPPFSLFRKFIQWVSNKKYLVLGNNLAQAYNEVINLIINNNLWGGCNYKGGTRKSLSPSLLFIDKFGNEREVSSIFFTNMDNEKKHKNLLLTAEYEQSKYPKFDNYDVISVNRIKDIPKDYYDVMGVPPTLLWHGWNPEQFEIINYINPSLNGKQIFKRLLIRRKH